MRIHPAYGSISELPLYPGEILGDSLPLPRIRVGDIITCLSLNNGGHYYVYDPDKRIESDRNRGSHWMADRSPESRYGWHWVEITFDE